MLCACGASTGKTDGTQGEQEQVSQEAPAPKGDLVETDKFTVVAAKGWEKMDIAGGVQLYKGSLMLQVSVTGMNVTPEEDLALLQSLAERYNGTEVEEVQMLGLTFYETFYTASGVEQVFYSAVKDGEQIHIQIGGSGFADNADIAAMLDSLELK
jgi:hypothetical protein